MASFFLSSIYFFFYNMQLDGLNEKILFIPTEGDTSLAKEFEKVIFQELFQWLIS